jgi:hypothetical protein
LKLFLLQRARKATEAGKEARVEALLKVLSDLFPPDGTPTGRRSREDSRPSTSHQQHPSPTRRHHFQRGGGVVFHSIQTFIILPKEKTTVWVKQNVNFFQQNGSVIKIEQN